MESVSHLRIIITGLISFTDTNMKQAVKDFKRTIDEMIRRAVVMIVLLCVASAAYAQQEDNLAGRIYLAALQYAKGSGKPYRPDKAMRIMSVLAEEGDPKAMNALGIMYATGKGSEIDYRAAMTWFSKAAEAGYLRSYYNLSLMWKYALGVEKNDEESFHMLKKGADAGDPFCQYGIGYMHYKGLGCSQDYGVAMNWFLKAAEEGNIAATYMIGLCLRNGYGVERDTATAREWLINSGRSGNARAAVELGTREPENSFSISARISGKRYSVTIPEKFRVVEHNVMRDYLSGRFEGYAVTYDWSGVYIIDISPLTLTLSSDDDLITGKWIEADTITADIRAVLTDTTLVFVDSDYARPNHYSPEPFPAKFRTADINLSSDGSSVYLTGNLHLFSEITMEPLQPVYISLKSAGESAVDHPLHVEEGSGVKMFAFPNPFTGMLNLSIELDGEADVHVDILTASGILVIEADCGRLRRGRNVVSLPAPSAPGLYVVRVRYGNREATFTVVKS